MNPSHPSQAGSRLNDFVESRHPGAVRILQAAAARVRIGGDLLIAGGAVDFELMRLVLLPRIHPRLEEPLGDLVRARIELNFEGDVEEVNLQRLAALVRDYDRRGLLEQKRRDAYLRLYLTSPASILGVAIPLWTEIALRAERLGALLPLLWNQVEFELEAEARGLTPEDLMGAYFDRS